MRPVAKDYSGPTVRREHNRIAIEVFSQNGEKTGARGCDLLRAGSHPLWRRTDFRPENGEGLHRFERTEAATGGRKNEQPWHRMVAYMLLSGNSVKEIAIAADVTPSTISQLRANRWFQQLLTKLSRSEGDQVLGLIKSEAVASVEKLVSLRDRADSDRVQLSAAQTLLEQAVGRPVQKNVVAKSDRTGLTPQEEYEILMQELEALKNSNGKLE